MAALAIREPALLQDLEKDVEHVGMRLLDLVEEHDRVRPAAHRLGELAALVVAHVSRRRADELGDGVPLHELGHVEGDEGLLGAEEELRERLGELGLAHARGAQEDERAARPARVLERAAAAADGLATLVTASSWPTTRWCSTSSQRRSLEASASVRLVTGTPVMDETTSAMSSSSTVTTLAASSSRHAASSSSRRATSAFSSSRRRAASSNSWAAAAADFSSRTRARSASTWAISGGRAILWTRVRAPASSRTSMALSGRKRSWT